jgi:hypothetical protein
MITQNNVKAAMREAIIGEKVRIELKDDGARGEGRLALSVRALNGRVIAEWHAVYYRDGRRTMSKIASYPDLSIADARKKFREKYAPAITRGAEPKNAAARRRDRRDVCTVRELFETYVGGLRAAGKRSSDAVERKLLDEKCGAAHAIGADRPAASIDAQHCTLLVGDTWAGIRRHGRHCARLYQRRLFIRYQGRA